MVYPLSTATRPTLSGKISLTAQKWAPTNYFFDSGVDFIGEYTVTSLEAQICLQQKLLIFKVDVGMMSVWVKKELRMGIPRRTFSDKYEPGAGVWYSILPLSWTLASNIATPCSFCVSNLIQSEKSPLYTKCQVLGLATVVFVLDMINILQENATQYANQGIFANFLRI